MSISISTAHNEARLGGTLTYLDTGSANAKIRIYSGTRPAFGGAATTMLCEFVLAKPSGTIASGTLTISQPTDAQVQNSGVASWARVVNGNGDVAFDCDCSDNLGSGEIKLTNTQLYAGGYAHLISATLT